MFKLYFVFIILYVDNLVNSEVIIDGLTKQQLQDIEIKTMEECKKEFNIDENMYIKFFNSSSSLTPTTELKCMLNRFAEKMGFLKEKKTDWDAIISVENIHYEDGNDRKKAMEAIDVCRKSVVDVQDPCESSYQVAKCLRDEYRKACVGGC